MMSPASEPAPPPHSAAVPRAGSLEERLAQLPPYTRSLLRIQVPVRVTLASCKLPLKRILELGQGSIIPFNKSCEEPLSLAVGNCEVAVGEAVKVGNKFGLRITSMVMPQERFYPLKVVAAKAKALGSTAEG
jgi:flagellar motor switch/type III secretory pathway protein FliN